MKMEKKVKIAEQFVNRFGGTNTKIVSEGTRVFINYIEKKDKSTGKIEVFEDGSFSLINKTRHTPSKYSIKQFQKRILNL